MGYIGVWRDGVCSNGWWFMPGARLTGLDRWRVTAGDRVTVYGEGFGAQASDVWATVDGVQVPIVSWSPTEIVIEIPQGATMGYVGVWREGWVCSNGIFLLVVDQAHIDSVDMTTVVPGQEIVLMGSDFGAPDPYAAVMIGGVHVWETVMWSDTVIIARVPLGAQTGYLGVWKHGVASNGIWLEVLQ
jgi:hypothetical protein